MSMLINCAKGCGEAINVTDEEIDLAKSKGVPLNVSHEICPNDPLAPKHGYKIVIEAFIVKNGEEEPEKLVRLGHDVEATSFVGALPGLQQGLNEQWERIIGMAAVVDAEFGEPVPQPKKELEQGEPGHLYTDSDIAQLEAFSTENLKRFIVGDTHIRIKSSLPKQKYIQAMLDHGYHARDLYDAGFDAKG